MLRHVSTSVSHHQAAHLFLAKITCLTSVVIDYKPGKTHKIVRQIKYIKYMNVIYTVLKTLVCKIVFRCGGIYTVCKIWRWETISSRYDSIQYSFVIFRRVSKSAKSDYWIVMPVLLSLCLPVCPSHRLHRTTRLPLDGLSLYTIFEYFSKTCREILSFINRLKTKRRLFYLKTQFLPRSKHFSSRL